MPKLIDITGRRYGELTVIGRSETVYRHRRKWICRCDCGETTEVLAYTLSCGDTTTCGKHRSKQYIVAKGQPNPLKRKYPEGADTKSRLWTVYRSMHMRCEKPSHAAYPRYGGRGIKICADWSHNFGAFSAWALANGYSDDLTLDRIDNDKGYQPDNCRWITRAEQSLNKRDNILVTAFGETKPLSAWTRDPRCTVSPYQCYKRIRSGHYPEFAMTATESEIRTLAATQREATLKARGMKRTFGRVVKVCNWDGK